MRYRLRRANLDRVDDYGVAFDFNDIMNYFNLALRRRDHLMVPRRRPITRKELLSSWMPNARIGKTVNFVAFDRDLKKVIGNSALHIHNDKAVLSFVKDPRCQVKGVSSGLVRKAISYGVSQGLVLYAHGLKECRPMHYIMCGFNLSVTSELDEHKSFRDDEFEGEVISEWEITRENWRF